MKKIQILLVEDNEGDVLLTTEALETMTFEHEITVLKTGKAAVDYLIQSNGYPRANLPDLVLLDINLPVKNGLEVLAVIKSTPKTKHIPVIMLTTSSSRKDKEASELLDAEMFITKPTDIINYDLIVRSIEEFWINYSTASIENCAFKSKI